MTLPTPNLDDRTFEQLMETARSRIRESAPGWTDLSAGDPGVVLLETFAHMTETMLYRLNRLPEKAYIEFLNLLGVRLHPPAAATVALAFTRDQPGDEPLEIPGGTRVTVNQTAASGSAREEPPVFVTTRSVTIPAGDTTAHALAFHGVQIAGELAGLGTGLPGLSVRVKRPPIVASTDDPLGLLVGVEARPDELHPEGARHARTIQFDGKIFHIWREVTNFTDLGDDPHAYVVDRRAGTVTFAPALRMETGAGELHAGPEALGAVPPAGRQIRCWYRHGGGAEGNVAANTLTVLKDTVPGVRVTNPYPASGGRAAESVENALERGPQQLHSLQRAVTAADFEQVALANSRAVARARALTRAALWSHADPGAVEVMLVPHLPAHARGEMGLVSAAMLGEQETETVLDQIQQSLDRRRPLGTTCLASWTRYKTVHVKARVVVRREEDKAAVQRRVLERLYGTITPLATEYSAGGWPYGRALRTSHVYDIALAEPGVLWVDRVSLGVDSVPDADITAVTADRFQPDTWYAASGSTLFRSLNNGDGWESAGTFAGERLELVRTHPDRAGYLAAISQAGESGSQVHVSTDCGEHWHTVTATAFRINDVAWTVRDDEPVLLMATDVGLYEVTPGVASSPIQILVDPQDQDLGFYAVIASRDIRGQISVAVAARSTEGVYLSSQAGRANTFRHTGLRGEDVRVLAVQYDGPRAFLWAGVAAAGGDDQGKGCFRWELRGSEDPPEGWRAFGQGWTGGSCRGIAFLSDVVVAATYRSGVLRLARRGSEAEWQAPDVNCGLPLRDPGRFHVVDSVATAPRPGGAASEGRELVMIGSAQGVYRSRDGGASYEAAFQQEFGDRIFGDRITLPPTWLFCSGEHEVTVESEDETERD